MTTSEIKQLIDAGQLSIGIEFGSTRIKTVAIDSECRTIATGSFEWENQFKHGYWTYSMNDVWVGLQRSYAEMTDAIKDQYDTTVRRIASLGISGMMHGYLVFDEHDDLLVPFRTWRNNNANEAASILREDFQVNIPERWSIAQLYQSAIDKEEHVPHVRYMTTLAGYVHWYLSGERVLGIGDASGMFPIDSETLTYRSDLLQRFNTHFHEAGYTQQIEDILPEVVVAGQSAGRLTEIGAKLIDPHEELEAGCPMCAPEADAATGMVATNSVAPRTGNVSAGTSIFSMIVLEKQIQQLYPEVDIVSTPDGYEVAMIHANNCTSDINAWVGIFEELLQRLGVDYDKNNLFTTLFESALDGDDDLGQLLSIGYVSGEFITDVPQGYPLLLRSLDSNFNLANFMKSQIYSAFATLKIGIDLLKENEQIQIDSMLGHGGIFTTKEVAQRFMAAALESSVSVMQTASEGGAWGIAVLARYLVAEYKDLAQFLNDSAFEASDAITIEPTEAEIESFRNYTERFKAGMELEHVADQQFNSNKDRKRDQ
ncbi:xylulokinase [Staphylococcus pettenkoferi]|uniref:FGGY-family carbohydrate kinase n=2 Tax=Staphylococcus TaxID=1279 RepID=A0A9Q4D9S9_9STAP|nr:FGGY-family carbohydrate kinase [Staphylococcus pettenkoferi]MCI2802858.1 FGGY-family carbohydrate kinase [Staphylococcus pettenkoferi]MCY1563542.1 FGGY-family carbohydrate kinase [Staphylococcus pettenkoferi]MCY1570309.1 FGGY-family carbohydrate kinase [Staphylococcus pettenkoferi]MCY1571713.1 FGGY-family carbohydrate kinase [Staphylococcus pettenkoferi]MCY1582112.1 FGGY-family carbohydrate kinase [Staphylococcus pettenkoferi]